MNRVPHSEDQGRWNSLRAQLRAGDPYTGPLEANDSARLRQALRAAAFERRSRRSALGWSLAAASLAAGIVLFVGRPAPPPPSPASASAPVPAPPAASQLHFVTPGGTRVVWVLRADDLKL